MPEGHVIHRLARDHRKRFVGQSLAATSPQGRFRSGARRLNSGVLEDVQAYGKHLLYAWEGGQILHVHLGLYGRFRTHRCPPPPPRGAVRLRVVGESHAFDLNGPAACELLSEEQRAKLIARLGPDPLRRDADPNRAWHRISRSKAAIGTLLLDQSVLAGAGNIYRSEVLFATHIHPERSGRSLSHEQFLGIWRMLVTWMRVGVRYNRIITVAPEDCENPLGRLRREERLLIYKRPLCRRCDGAVSAWELGARMVYACLSCQI